jgi:hypothetical protein
MSFVCCALRSVYCVVASAGCWFRRCVFLCRAFCVQPSFELGVLAYELCTGEHPVHDYPVDLDYAAEDLPGTVSPWCRESECVCYVVGWSVVCRIADSWEVLLEPVCALCDCLCV